MKKETRKYKKWLKKSRLDFLIFLRENNCSEDNINNKFLTWDNWTLKSDKILLNKYDKKLNNK